ncbi:MAG: RNA-binding S4 domain-containing protein [Muribaculaceae bacterium]|jgi:ribosome-associated heat shock protein Hsp15|nr:RNA-binding S4 domain-containing protein [Muribaculaceae bacterium]
MKEVRIDKWLWATRVFKTRTIATTACKLGRVTIGGMPVKPSHGIKVGDRIDVRKPPVTYSFEVIALLNNRVGAKLVPQYLKNVTSADQLRLLEMVKIDGFVNRQRGLGRPTKKEGRELQEFTDDAFFGFDEPTGVASPALDDAFDWDEEENPLWTQEDEDRLNEDIERQRREKEGGE